MGRGKMYSPGFSTIHPDIWKPDQVRAWLEWTTTHYNLRDPGLTKLLFLDGPDLCRMNQEDFRRMAGHHSGDILHSHLEFLKSQQYSIKSGI